MKPSSFGRGVCLVAFSAVLWDAGATVISKKDALEIMKKNGFKWKQTMLFGMESEAQRIQADSAFSPHLQVRSREIVARINQIQFGFDSPGSLNIITVGSTALEGALSLIDKSSVDRLNAALSNEKYAAANSKQYQNDLIYVMLLQFLNSQRLKKKLEVIDLNLQRDNEIFKMAQSKVDSGVGIALDVMRARGLVDFDNLKKLDANASYEKAKQEFMALIGDQGSDIDFLPISFREFDDKDQQIRITEAKTNRYDVLASKHMVDVTRNLKMQMEEDDHLKLTLAGDVGIIGTHIVGGVGSAVGGSLGIQLLLPVFDGDYNKGRVQEASVKVQRAELQAKQLELDVDTQIKVALIQLKDARTAVDVSNSQVRVAGEELKLAHRRFAMGSSSGLEISNAQSSVALAADGNVDALFSFEISKVNYYKAIGNFVPYFEAEKGANEH